MSKYDVLIVTFDTSWQASRWSLAPLPMRQGLFRVHVSSFTPPKNLECQSVISQSWQCSFSPDRKPPGHQRHCGGPASAISSNRPGGASRLDPNLRRQRTGTGPMKIHRFSCPHPSRKLPSGAGLGRQHFLLFRIAGLVSTHGPSWPYSCERAQKSAISQSVAKSGEIGSGQVNFLLHVSLVGSVICCSWQQIKRCGNSVKPKNPPRQRPRDSAYYPRHICVDDARSG